MEGLACVSPILVVSRNLGCQEAEFQGKELKQASGAAGSRDAAGVVQKVCVLEGASGREGKKAAAAAAGFGCHLLTEELGDAGLDTCGVHSPVGITDPRGTAETPLPCQLAEQPGCECSDRERRRRSAGERLWRYV